MFFSCPTIEPEIEEWFVDLWNYSLSPYLLQTMRSGLGLGGQRCSWLDPLDWILHTYPWQQEGNLKSKLRRLRMEDVGCRERVSQETNPEQEQLVRIQILNSFKTVLRDFLKNAFFLKD